MEQNFGIEVNYGNNIGYLGSPRYGIFNPNVSATPLQELLKYLDVAYLPDRASGQPFSKLAPRTLPNGVSNTDYTQNVSGDVVLQASDIESAVNRTNITTVSCVLFSNQRVVLGSANVIGNFNVNGRTETPNTGSDDVANIGKFYLGSSSGKMLFIFPLGTTLEQARALLAGTVIRYQLATPIDTLNSPIFTNPLIDLKGKAPLTLNGFAGTSADGYAVVPSMNNKVGLQFDGVNSFGQANHPALDIVGTGDFALVAMFRTGATLVSSRIVCKNLDSSANVQYAVFFNSNGTLSLDLNGASAVTLPVGTLQPNTLYKLLAYRYNGFAKIKLNDITASIANIVSITTQPNFRVGARSASVDGVTNTSFVNINLGLLGIRNGTFDEAGLIKAVDTFAEKVFGITG